MTTGQILSDVAAHLLDKTTQDYTPEELAPFYRQALDELSGALATNGLPEVTSHYYGTLAVGAHTLSPAFHKIPLEQPKLLEVRSLVGRYTLQDTLPAEVAGAGVTITFQEELPLLPENRIQIIQEARVPSILGEWGIQVADGRRSALVVEAPFVRVGDDDQARAGYLLVGQGTWSSLTTTRLNDRYLLPREVTEPLQFKLTVQGFTPANYLTEYSIPPVPRSDIFLINRTAALAAGRRGMAVGMFDQDAAMGMEIIVGNAVRDMQSTPRIPPIRRLSHAHILRGPYFHA